MILLEVVDAEQRKVAASQANDDNVPTRRHPEPTQPLPPPPPSPRLPDYATSQAQAEQQDGVKKSTKQGDRRLGRAVVYALAIYLGLSAIIALPLFLVLRGKGNQPPVSTNPQNWVKSSNIPPDQLPPDVLNLPSIYGQPIECNNWTHVNTSGTLDSFYQLSYLIPSNETIYLRSNFSDMEDDALSPVDGTLLVSVTNDTSQREAIVSVHMKDIGEEALKEANVCLMRTDSGWGLAIYVPDDANEDKYYLDVELNLPLPSGPSPLSGLATYLPSFNQTFKQLDSYMGLGSFNVQGSLGNINVESVHAQSILVKASAAGISGTFNSTDRVILETILAPITANVSLYNDGLNRGLPGFMKVETGNSNITLNVTLYGPSNNSDYCPPTFVSHLRTFGGALEASYRHDPYTQPASLFVHAVNSLEPAQIFVDSKFEGTYDVHATLADAVLDRDTDLVDPTGAGRQRTYVDDLVSANRAYGWAGWGARPTGETWNNGQGHIEVVSSLGAAILQLTDAPNANLLASKVSKAVFSQT